MAAQAVFFSEVRERARHYRVAPGVAHARLVNETIDPTIARAHAAIFELVQAGRHSSGESGAG